MNEETLKAIADAIMMSVGIIQGAYDRFLDENDGDVEVALRLTDITWHGLMSTVNNATNNGLDRLC